MRQLPPRVGVEAIDIANALLGTGYDEGKVIRIAIAKAEEWAAAQGIHRSDSKTSREALQ